ncbi:F-box/WD repeat-containing protein 10 [Periophthalmus magnuspinnatus]|uniref:F-box/WD repeat-containing protein 10 n=1 Tax=Periophthalmus magnuspinnatus TaxID=409849 RepID=UPI002436947D|nr:F-box/WD repeat-containing protein 10 [Periophthalmus magnuspinnatus]
MDKITDSRNSPDLDLTEYKPCVHLCGMCPSCAFAKTPPISTDHLWTVGDSFHRRFIMDLLCRCRSLQVLEKMHRVLAHTSWSFFSYGISEKLASSTTSISTKPQEKPLGFNGHEIREWFDSRPDWIKSHYLCRLLLRCDSGLLRALANLTDVLLIRQKRGQVTFEGCNTNSESGESDEPALMVVPGSSKSYSGISRYKDFISSLPVNLSKRILGLLDQSCLKICIKVSSRWQSLAKETLSEIEFRKSINETWDMVKSKDNNFVSPIYANVVQVQVPGHLKIKLVQMEERNIYCSGFVTTEIIDKHDPHRVIDYRGSTMMAVGSKDGTVQILYVSVEAKVVSVLKGNVVQVRAVRLCEDKDLVITGSSDGIIRCWNLKSKTCVMTLSGHMGAVNSLDVWGDRLVSGAKDNTVKVWDLQKGKVCEEFNFKHPSSVQCVKIHQTRVYSSCDKGKVKIWDLEKAAVLKAIDGHQSSVRCLFFDEWHLLTGDVEGAVMAWSTHCEAKDCIKTFTHPKEVRSVTLTYLRVVTGCADGKIRIFNFLTGACLRVIVAGAKSNLILSIYFHEHSFVVNSTAHVKRYYFGEVFWDYADAADEDKKHIQNEKVLISDTPEPRASAPVNKVSSPDGKTHNRRKSLPNLTSSSAKWSTQEQIASVKMSQSENAASVRIQKRGPHHPPTRDYILLKVNATQKAELMDEVGLNMEHNAKLRDDWNSAILSNDSPTKTTSTPISKTGTLRSKYGPQRDVSTAPGCIIRPHPPLAEKSQSQSVKAQRLVNTSAKNIESKEQPKNLKAKWVSDLESFLKSSKDVKSVDAFNDQEFKLLTLTQLEEHTKSQKDLKAKK